MRHRIALFGLLWLLPASLLCAALLVPLPIEKLVSDAQLVVRGKVLSKTCRRDDAGRIYTEVELAPSETWKGTAPHHPLVIVHSGGILGDQKVIASAQVEYKIGEEVVAFLIYNERGEAVTLAMSQGKFHVSKDPETGQYYVQNPFHGTSAGSSGASHSLSAAAPGSAGPLTLVQLQAQVEGIKQ